MRYEVYWSGLEQGYDTHKQWNYELSPKCVLQGHIKISGTVEPRRVKTGQNLQHSKADYDILLT